MKHYIIKEFWIGEFPKTNWVSVRMSFHFPLWLSPYVGLHAGEALSAGVFRQCVSPSDCSEAPADLTLILQFLRRRQNRGKYLSALRSSRSFCFLGHWLASSVPVAVAHCLFTGCSVWENISSLIIDNRLEQWACPSRHIGFNLWLLGSWLVCCTLLSWKFEKSECFVGCCFPILINTCQTFCHAALEPWQLLGQISVLIPASLEVELRTKIAISSQWLPWVLIKLHAGGRSHSNKSCLLSFKNLN